MNMAVNKTLFTESGRGRGCPVCGPRREAWALPRLETREQPWLGGCRGGGVTPRYPRPIFCFLASRLHDLNAFLFVMKCM